MALVLGPCGPDAWGAPPPVPKAFTREVVEELMAKVDEGHNAMVLKVPYLVSRRKHPFPHHEGLRMMREAVKLEKAGSKRWILLKSLCAFGGRQRGAFLEVKTYAELFQNQLKQPNADASREVNIALADFLKGYSSCPYPATVRSAKTADAMRAALQLYLSWPELRHKELDFAPVLKKAKGIKIITDALGHAVSSALAGEHGSTYMVLKRSGAIYKPWKPLEALALFPKAEPLLDRKDAHETERFYTHVVDVLVALKRVDEPMAAQKKLHDLTGGRGQVRLMALREQAGEQGALGQGLSGLDYAKIGEKEMTALYGTLVREEKYDEVIAVLTQYLEAPRILDPGYELWARYRLASVHANRKSFERAREAADVSHLKPPFTTSRARIYHRRLENFSGRLPIQAGNK